MEVLNALISQLPSYLQADGSAMWYRKLRSVHTISNQSLRMPGICHVDALPPFVRGMAIFVRKGNYVFCLREYTHQIQNIGKRNPDPFGNKRPTFFAGLLRDLAAGRK